MPVFCLEALELSQAPLPLSPACITTTTAVAFTEFACIVGPACSAYHECNAVLKHEVSRQRCTVKGCEHDAVRCSSHSRKQITFRRNSADGHKYLQDTSKSGRPVARGVAVLHAALPH